LQNDCLRIANSPPCLYVVGLKAQIARRMAGLLIRRLFDTFPRSTEILDGLAVRSSEEIIRGAAEHKLECSFVAFCRSNVKRGRRFSKSICLRSQESGTRTCGKESVRERALSSSQSSEH